MIGLATAFNVIIIKWKFEHNRFDDAWMDIGVLIALSWVFGGTMGGMIIATISSAVVSLYLLASPPKFSEDSEETDGNT